MSKTLANVPVFILAGGFGTRLSEESQNKPKPMIEVGGIPIIVHIMRRYYSYGFNDFVICAGYRAATLKEFFVNYGITANHVDIDHRTDIHAPHSVFGTNLKQERWRVRIVDTGLNTMTGARIVRAAAEIGLSQDDTIDHFAVTYGDGLSDVPLDDEFDFHVKHGKIGTLLSVPTVSRFGELRLSQDGVVEEFIEKPARDSSMINGGFFYFKKKFLEYLSQDEQCILERRPLYQLTEHRELVAYPYSGFWHCMDTLRDKMALDSLWDSGNAPWLPKKR